jgi:hypothetical protein
MTTLMSSSGFAVPARQAPEQDSEYERTPADAVALALHDSAALARKRQPRRVVSFLGGLLAIDVG